MYNIENFIIMMSYLVNQCCYFFKLGRISILVLHKSHDFFLKKKVVNLELTLHSAFVAQTKTINFKCLSSNLKDSTQKLIVKYSI